MSVVLLGWLVPLVLAQAPQPRSVAVVALDAEGAALEPAVRAALGTEPSLRVQSQSDTLMTVEMARDAGFRCSGEPACLASLGKGAGVAWLVHVSARDGVARVVTVDVRTASTAAESGGVLPPPGALRDQVVGRLARVATGTGGTLELECAGCDARSFTVGWESGLLVPGAVSLVAGLPAGPLDITATTTRGTALQRRVEVPASGVLRVRVTPRVLLLPGETEAVPAPAPAPASPAPRERAAWSPSPVGVALLAVGGVGAVTVVGLGAVSVLVAALGAALTQTVARTSRGMVAESPDDTPESLRARVLGGMALLGAGTAGALVCTAVLLGSSVVGVAGGALLARE